MPKIVLRPPASHPTSPLAGLSTVHRTLEAGDHLHRPQDEAGAGQHPGANERGCGRGGRMMGLHGHHPGPVHLFGGGQYSPLIGQ